MAKLKGGEAGRGADRVHVIEANERQGTNPAALVPLYMESDHLYDCAVETSAGVVSLRVVRGGYIEAVRNAVERQTIFTVPFIEEQVRKGLQGKMRKLEPRRSVMVQMLL